jgi:hypothetical protein
MTVCGSAMRVIWTYSRKECRLSVRIRRATDDDCSIEWHTVIRGFWINGIDMPAVSHSVSEDNSAVALTASDLQDPGAGGDIPEGDEVKAVIHLPGYCLFLAFDPSAEGLWRKRSARL